MAKALFLDFDGTLVDSLAAMRDSYERFLAGHGIAGSDAEFQSLNGPPLTEVVGRLRTRYGLAPPPVALLEQYRALLTAAQRGIRPSAGARELLAAAQARSIPVAVVTSADAVAVTSWLARHDLRSFIAGVVGGDGVTRGKPDPEPYARALHLLGCAAHAGLAIEDSHIGAQAAVAAGLTTYVLVPSPRPAPDWPGVAGFIDRLSDAIGLLDG